MPRTSSPHPKPVPPLCFGSNTFHLDRMGWGGFGLGTGGGASMGCTSDSLAAPPPPPSRLNISRRDFERELNMVLRRL